MKAYKVLTEAVLSGGAVVKAGETVYDFLGQDWVTAGTFPELVRAILDKLEAA